MSENTKTDPQFNPEASIAGAAAAESAEILNLLGETSESGGSCCGGACCSA
jgi:hypothetical protein